MIFVDDSPRTLTMKRCLLRISNFVFITNVDLQSQGLHEIIVTMHMCTWSQRRHKRQALLAQNIRYWLHNIEAIRLILTSDAISNVQILNPWYHIAKDQDSHIRFAQRQQRSKVQSFKRCSDSAASRNSSFDYLHCSHSPRWSFDHC